jgi:hypothetical protein
MPLKEVPVFCRFLMRFQKLTFVLHNKFLEKCILRKQLVFACIYLMLAGFVILKDRTRRLTKPVHLRLYIAEQLNQDRVST